MVGKELTRWWPVLEVGSHVRQLSLLPSYDLCDIVEHLVSWMKKSGLYPRLLGGKCQVPGMLHQIGMSCLPGNLNHTNMIWSQDSEPIRASLPTRRVFKEDSGTYVQSPSRILDRGSHTGARKPCVWNALVFPQTLYHALLWADFNLYPWPVVNKLDPLSISTEPEVVWEVP